MNPMMMGAMMPNMAAMMAQMPPEMAEISKRMLEQRQKLMQEFQANGGQSNPAAVQELMSKAAQFQQTMMAEIRAKMESGALPSPAKMMPSASTPINPIDLVEERSQAPVKPLGEGLLGANANMSKLDDIINKRATAQTDTTKRAREEEEQRISDAISKKEFEKLNAVKATQYGIFERLKELVDSGQCDPNVPDSENVYLLHWAAINNRVEIAKYLLSGKKLTKRSAPKTCHY